MTTEQAIKLLQNQNDRIAKLLGVEIKRETWEDYGTRRELRRAKIEKLILLFLVGGFAVFAGLQAILK